MKFRIERTIILPDTCIKAEHAAINRQGPLRCLNNVLKSHLGWVFFYEKTTFWPHSAAYNSTCTELLQKLARQLIGYSALLRKYPSRDGVLSVATSQADRQTKGVICISSYNVHVVFRIRKIFNIVVLGYTESKVNTR
jgi:hypothetical protein